MLCYLSLSTHASIKEYLRLALYLALPEIVLSLTLVVSVPYYSIGINLRAAAKSVVGDSTGREIRELMVRHNDPILSNI